MACRGCEDKVSRYGGVKMGEGDIDNRENNHMSQGSMQHPSDPMSAFFSAKHFSYEELKERQDFSKEAAKKQSEHIMSEMTDAMKQIHLEELIATANSEMMSIPGMTSDQAVVAIKDALDRHNFKFVETLYPGLKEAVNSRYTVIINNRLPVRKEV